MKIAVILLVILSRFFFRGQKTEIQYLSGLDKDHTVQWDFCSYRGFLFDLKIKLTLAFYCVTLMIN